MISRVPNTVSEALPRAKQASTRNGRVISVGNGIAEVQPVGSSAVVRVTLVGSNSPARGDRIVYQQVGNRRMALTSGEPTSGSGGSGSTIVTGGAGSFLQLQGIILDNQAPQFLKIDGSRALEGNLPLATGITIDGVDPDVLQASHNALLASFTAFVGGIAETVQDIVGVMFAPQIGMVLSYSDSSGKISASVLYGTPGSILPGSTASAGVLDQAARADHRHQIVVAAPGANSVNLAASLAGSASSFARSDHTHQLDQSIAPTWTGKHQFTADAVVNGSTILTTGQVWINAGLPNGTAAIKAVPPNVNAAGLWLIQRSGQTAPLMRIEAATGQALIVLTPNGALQSGNPGFVSGTTGWSIFPNGDAEFNALVARGELRSSVFVRSEIHASGGTLMVATAGTLLESVSTV